VALRSRRAGARRPLQWGGLLFGYFLLATQEKVTRSPEASEKRQGCRAAKRRKDQHESRSWDLASAQPSLSCAYQATVMMSSFPPYSEICYQVLRNCESMKKNAIRRQG
ncbi:MAG TPA: hypothetical protein VFN25_07510, partial [Dokdonella sp.]|uniref:hypothetical protein n=1 Tax=Dokdonella sp. TaxID=2291710 RepID=UPI002D80AB58